MQVITAEQRASTNPVMREWVAAKDAQNAAEAAGGAAAAAAVEAAQIAAWKVQTAAAAAAANPIVSPTPAQGYTPTPVITSYPTQQTSGGSSTVTSQPTGNVSPTVTVAATEKDKRMAAAGAFTGWDNDASIRAKQQKWWDIYIATGVTNSPEQIQLNADAEAMRKAINLSYVGVGPAGTPNKAAADALILPTDQFPTTNGLEGALSNLINGGANGSIGSVLGLVLSGGLILFIITAFKK